MDGKALKKILDPWPLNHKIHRGIVNLIMLLQCEIDDQNERTQVKRTPISSERYE